eukprot:TRINITY_DN821_c0_g1_i1.p1 TRINITY_DN821_c0_g1~~TRINITY_DN821_c0_g1_i1.p1  ORF type:complete len:723 (-),score=227.15 TRINITY_DN821_c0_g1_i1:150-2318(-)
MSDSAATSAQPEAAATQPEAPAAAPAKNAPKKGGAPKKEAGAKKEAKPKKAGGGKVDVSKFPLPPYAEHRIKLWEEYKKQAEAAVESKPIKVTLPDARVVDAEAGKTTPLDIARSISKNLANDTVAAKVNGKLVDAWLPLSSDCTLELVTFNSPDGQHVFWHSSAHILGQALERRFACNLTIGPALSDGFYYDAGTKEAITQDHFPEIEAVVQDIVSQKQPFERLALTKDQIKEIFNYNPYKMEIINQITSDDKITAYRCGPFIDLCRGPHLPDTGKVKAFSITKNSSAYWRGKAENDSLQRVYGISFPDKKQLTEYQNLVAEAAKRDHRNIGKLQELFFFHPLSPGSCFFLPHGTRIYNKLVEFMRAEYRKRGFTEVLSPNVYNGDLWLTSGHWPYYKENMFIFDCEGAEFALKPMNCPGHCLMFGHRTRSYRELPIRFADFGVLHRNELSGALTGLTRVRRFQQDDAHIFCAEEMIKSEIGHALEFVKHVYGVFGYEFALELSTRPEKFLGDIEVWDRAEKALEEALNNFGKPWKINPGDGAFYGPKIDIHISDALKRSHQCATIQLDFQLPLRFKLEYQAEDGTIKRPVIIHRAILGSVERMMAILIEHTGGKWPFWLSPRQAIVVPVMNSPKLLEYAEHVKQTVHDAGFYVDADLSDKQLNKKIREAQLAQYNYILVVGNEELEKKSVAVRLRDNTQQGVRTIDEIVAEFQNLAKTFK